MCEASRPTFRIHISGAHRGARKNHLFRPLAAFLILFFWSLSVQSVRSCQNFARDLLLSRGLQNLRAKILCEPREKIPLRAKSSPESSFFARALYDFARDCLSFARPGKDLRARLFNFARPWKRLRARLYTFARAEIFLRADCKISREILRQQLYFSCIDFAYSRIFAANCSWFYIFCIFWFFGTA